MFKCTDCGQEYEIKPNFCDCGNDTFEEIVPVQNVSSSSETKRNIVYPTQDKDINYHNKETNKTPSSSRSNYDVPSVIIFVCCIILSILSIIFIGNNNSDEIDETKQTVTQENINIPSIDKLWNNGNVKNTSKPKSTPKVVVQQTPTIREQVYQPVQSYNKTNVNKKNTKPQQQIQQPKQTITTTKQPQKQTVVKPQKNTATQVQTQVTTTTKPVSVPQTQPVTLPQKQIKQTNTTVNTTVNPQALQNYKINLRNHLAKSINFTNIIGDGNCSVSFKVDAAGNLINRKFAVQSDNDSLNREVHNAIMQNPTYQSPPTNYKGETFTFNVKMYGGRFNVTLY